MILLTKKDGLCIILFFMVKSSWLFWHLSISHLPLCPVMRHLPRTVSSKSHQYCHIDSPAIFFLTANSFLTWTLRSVLLTVAFWMHLPCSKRGSQNHTQAPTDITSEQTQAATTAKSRSQGYEILAATSISVQWRDCASKKSVQLNHSPQSDLEYVHYNLWPVSQVILDSVKLIISHLIIAWMMVAFLFGEFHKCLIPQILHILKVVICLCEKRFCKL